MEQSSRLFPYLKRVLPPLHSQLPPHGAANLRLCEGGCIFLCLFTIQKPSNGQGRWTCSPTCRPANPRSWSMCPATSTAPGPMTACGFPTANGAGFPVGSAVTARWTISSRSTAIPFWRPWKPSPAGRPSRRLPLCQRRKRKSPSTCFCPRPPRITGR